MSDKQCQVGIDNWSTKFSCQVLKGLAVNPKQSLNAVI